MKRSEKIYAEVTGLFKTGELGEELMKESAWCGWQERFTRTLNKKMKDTAFEGITPLVPQRFEFNEWWYEEIADPTRDS